MLFKFTREFLWLVTSAFAVFKIRKTKIVRKKLASVLACVLSLILVTVSSMYPVENLFVRFKSPESVFNYANFGKIKDVVYGKESCMIIFTNRDGVGQHYIMPKVENGYKIPNQFASKKIFNRFDSSGNFDVYHVSGTQDYYIVGKTLSNSAEQKIVDCYNRPVKNISYSMGKTETKKVVVYSYIENFNNDYSLVINGEKIKMTK